MGAGAGLTFADKHPEVGQVGRVPLQRPPQISAKTLPVQVSLSGDTTQSNGS